MDEIVRLNSQLESLEQDLPTSKSPVLIFDRVISGYSFL